MLKECVAAIVADRDVASAVALMAESAELRAPQNQWTAFELIKLVAGSEAEPEAASFLAEAIMIWPRFFALQSEIMQSATAPATIAAAANNIMLELQQRGESGPFALPAWAVRAALEALCLVGRRRDLALLEQVILPEDDDTAAQHVALADRLLTFLDSMSGQVAHRKTDAIGAPDCVFCVHMPKRQRVKPTTPVFHIALGEIGLNEDDLLDAFVVRVFLRAVALRIAGKGVLLDDRGLVALQGQMGLGDLASARLLAQLHFTLTRIRKGEWLRGMGFIRAEAQFPFGDIQPRGAYVRGGNVELTAIACWLSDRAATLDAAERVVAELWEAQASSAQIALPAALRLYDNAPEAAILRLCLQAGWYSTPGQAGTDFEAWGEGYLEAFENNNVIEGHNIYFLPAQPLGFPHLAAPVRFREARFFELLHGRRVVMVSAFSQEIAAYHAQGHLDALWSAVGLDCSIAGLVTIPAPFSIWPQYPGMGWQKTFDELFTEAAARMTETESDMFLVAAGCYGAPLAHAIGQRFPDALTLHYGHHINTCFGVQSGQTSLLTQFKKPKDAAPLIRSALGEKYPNTLNRADLHRYT